MALPLAAPFIDVLIARGGWRWLGAYGLIVAMGAAATALAVGLTVALFRHLGARLTRFVAQVVAAIIGAAFVIGLQIVAILSYGTISRAALLQSKTLLALAPSLDSALWSPARAALGQVQPLVVVLATSFVLLATAIAFVAPRFGVYAITAAGVGNVSVGRSRRTLFAKRLRRAVRTSPQGMDPAAARSMAHVADADADALSGTAGADAVAQFRQRNSALPLVVPVLVMAAGQLAGGLAWLAISGEDAPDLVATAPVPPVSSCEPRSRRYSARSRLSSHRSSALPLPPLGAGLSQHGGIGIAAAASTAVQFWFRSQAKRSHFRRRQVSSRLATFAEAFSSIGWAASAAVAGHQRGARHRAGNPRAPGARRHVADEPARPREA